MKYCKGIVKFFLEQQGGLEISELVGPITFYRHFTIPIGNPNTIPFSHFKVKLSGLYCYRFQL